MPLRRRVVLPALAAIIFGVLILAPALPGAQAPRTVQDGVYSAAQAARGQTLYGQRCAGCHGAALADGEAPPLAGQPFTSKWRQEPLSGLFIKIRHTMPPQTAGGAPLTNEQAADVVAHLLASSGYPAGATEFAAADAASSSVGWPAAPAGEPSGAMGLRHQPTGTLNQLMRGIFFPSSNLIFSVQEVEAKDLPPQPPQNKPDGLTVYEWGHLVYTGWPVVENAAVSLADASALLLLPGLRCENGRPAPVTEPDWIRFTEQMIAVARRTYRLAQTQDREAVSEYTADLSEACAACHRVYRDVGGRGRGRGAGALGIMSARCTHR